ncbi:hypothetical protein KC906_00855 [Candidatus Kaiserbacteria bacterium]|nr:hypothetical protein [Candidatus Kaiserbacteria bacterium]MCB9812399.1 hypothetical protein [Candidatus Nomurabacteria bacterium]
MKTLKLLIPHTIILALLLLPFLAAAQNTYKPLVGIPGVSGDPSTQGFDSYINALYALSISIAALLAVIKIVIAGVKWMMTDIVTSKGEAKKDIQASLIGLVIVIAAVLILTVINPNLVNVNLNMQKIGVTEQGGGGGGSGSTPVLDMNYVEQGQTTGNLDTATLSSSAPTGQVEAFFKWCHQQGRTPKNIGGEWRCIDYDNLEKTVISQAYCLDSLGAQCDVVRNTLKTNCEGTKNGVFFDGEIDSNGYRTYTCIQDRF